MSSVTVCTSFSPSGFKDYGRAMLQSAVQCLPKDVEILAYYNGEQPRFENNRVRFIDNYTIPNGIFEFLRRHGRDKKKWGIIPGQEKENFRFAINKFAHKMFSFYDASQHCSSDILLWIDADVKFFSEVSASFFDEILPEPHYMAVLERGASYFPEAGWVQVNTKHPAHREFMERYIDFCRKDLFLKEKEHHDAFLMGELIKQMKQEGKITVCNLSPRYDGSGHPWLVSRLAEFSDHKKGRRKQVGSSWQEDLKGTRPEPYWQNLPRRKDLN